MSKFVYGSLPRTLKPVGYLPGTITKAFGPRYVAVGILKQGEDPVEFGEFVALIDQDAKGYHVAPIDSDAFDGSPIAVVVRDIVGHSGLATIEGENEIVHRPKSHVPLSLFIGDTANKGKITVITDGTTNPIVGATVHIGLGTGATVAGIAYATAQGIAGVDSIASDWVFASTKFQPTNGAGFAVIVEYKG